MTLPNLDPAYAQLVVSLISLAVTGLGFFYFVKVQKAYSDAFNGLVKRFTPIVSNTMKNMRDQRTSSEGVQKFEQGMMEDVLNKGLPELSLLEELGLITPERMEWIRENPEGLMTLIDRWLPLAQKIITLRGGPAFQKETEQYDF